MASRRGDFSKAPIAALILEDGVEEGAPVEVRPQHRGDVQLGIGELPQQKVRQALLTGGANQQIGVAPRRRVQLGADRLFVDVFELLRALYHFFPNQPRPSPDLAPRPTPLT